MKWLQLLLMMNLTRPETELNASILPGGYLEALKASIFTSLSNIVVGIAARAIKIYG